MNECQGRLPDNKITNSSTKLFQQSAVCHIAFIRSPRIGDQCGVERNDFFSIPLVMTSFDMAGT